jgi:nucleotide-binding universal stress UspA family protein
MYETILVPLDGSRRAEAILPHVEGLAERLGAELILLRVVDNAPASVTTTPAQLRKEDVDAEQKDAQSYLAERQKKISDKGIKVKTSLLFGTAVGAIIEAAKEAEVDLIAMGSHGRSGLSHAFYGSVASGVLNRVDRPLLLVRSEES